MLRLNYLENGDKIQAGKTFEATWQEVKNIKASTRQPQFWECMDVILHRIWLSKLHKSAAQKYFFARQARAQYLLSQIDILGIEGWVQKTNISIEIKAALWDNWLVIDNKHTNVTDIITWKQQTFWKKYF